MKQVKVTTLVKFCTLLMLNNDKKHGYELLKDLERALGKKISASHVYPFLKSLEKKKIIQKKQLGNRKQYMLTMEGKEFMKNFFASSNELIALAVEPSLSVCEHCGCKVYKGAVAAKLKQKRYMFCCLSCKASFLKSF